MRTGGCSMHQTLTAQAATVVRNAVGLARRRGHAQATPLHVAATLLTSDSSLLRRACLQSRDGVTHPGGASSSASSLQCRALELCFNVALNRLPAAVQGQPASLSNALVAALKRAQAHQRRGCIEQQQHQPLLGVKVEMEQLIISILDDPSVSRVMREAGFYSDHVKNNVEAETLTLTMAGTNSSGLPFTVSSSSESQNIIRPNTDEDRRNYTFLHRQQQQEPKTPSDLCFLRQKPVMGNSEFLYSQGTRSKDVEFLIQALMLGESKRKNIVVVGEEELYTESIVRELMVRVESVNVPEALKSVRFIIPQFSGFWDEVELKLAELSRIIESCHDHGSNCIVYVGDLVWTLENHEREEFRMDSRNRYWYSPVGLVVKEVGRMLGRYADWIWLLGTATYHTYMRCNTRWPSLESEWGLQTLVVPAGGLSLTLFSSAIMQDTKMEDDKVYSLSNESESEFQITSSDGDINNCCAECSANFVVEARIFLDHKNSVITRSTETEMPLNNLLYWLPKHKNEESSTSTHQGTDSSERLRGLRKKWYQKCRSVHPLEFRQKYQTEMKMKRENFSPSSMVSGEWEEPRVMQRSPRNSRESYCITSNSPSLICSNQSEPISSSTQCHWPLVMGSVHSIDNSTRNFLFENNASGSHQDRKLEVDTTLALGRSETTSDHENTISDKLSSAKDILRCTKPSNRLWWQNAPSSPDSMSTSVGNDNFGRNTEMSNRRYMKFDLESLRILCNGLKEKVKWQSKITQAIATTVLRCRSEMARRQGGAVLKRDAWLLFLGPDKMGKRKMARALAEIVYGSEHKFACIGINNFNSIDHKNQDFHGLRGLRTMERLAELVRLDPHSVVLLEEIEQADTAVINSLVNAMETRKLLDSSGREVSISDAIIIMTSSLGVESHNTSGSSMDEDRLLSIMETSIKLSAIAQASTNTSSPSCISKVSVVDCKQYSKIKPIKDQRVGKFPCKRKVDCMEESSAYKSISKPSPRALDLNYSAEDFIESCGNTGASQDDCDLTADELYVLRCVQEYFSNNFFKLIDKTLVFQPFDFEQLEECLLDELNNAFSRVTGGNGCLHIDRTLMDHFVAASSWQYSSSPVQIFSKWVEDVFVDGLVKLLSVHKVSSQTLIRLIAVEKTEHSNSYLNSTLPTNFDILFS